MNPIAVIDIGTNSIRILAVKKRSDGDIQTLFHGMRMVRLGKEVDKNKLLSSQAIERTILTLKELKNEAQGLGVNSFFPLATSAVRDAGNSEEFVKRVRSATGLQVEILSGIEEAELSFKGAVWNFDVKLPVLVIDIGGGSTEFTIGSKKPVFSNSINIGAVRLTERFFKNDPISEDEYEKAALFLKDQITLLKTKLKEYKFETIIGVGGTITTIAAMKNGLISYNPDCINGSGLTYEDINSILKNLLAKTIIERQKIPGLQPERADIIPAGALIIKTIIETLGFNIITVRDSDLLLGYALNVFNLE